MELTQEQLNVIYELISKGEANRNKILDKVVENDIILKRILDLYKNKKSQIEIAKELNTDVNSVQEKIDLDNKISGMMGQLMVSVENYPQLKSDQTMLQAMQTYNEQEEHIAAARRFYNSAVKELNNAVEIFPSSLIAVLVNVKGLPFFEATETERQAVNADDYFTKH